MTKKRPIENLVEPLPSEPYSLDNFDPDAVLACLMALAFVLSTPIGAELFRELAKHYYMLVLDDKQSLKRYEELCEKRPCWEREQLCIHLTELGALIRCKTQVLYELVRETSTQPPTYNLIYFVIKNELIEYNRNDDIAILHDLQVKAIKACTL